MAMVEFKPKWLAQSPNAPADWVLCRTCAVRHMQSAKKQTKGLLCVPGEEADEVGYWRDVERRLRMSGWYGGRGTGQEL